MNYGNLIYNKISICVFDQKTGFCFRKVWICWNEFGYCWCVLYAKFLILDAFIGFCVIFCICEDTLKICFYIFEKMFRSVKNCRMNYLFVIWGDLWGPKWSTHPPTPCPTSMSKFPSQGKLIFGMVILLVCVLAFMKRKTGTRTITSCGIRRVGRR